MAYFYFFGIKDEESLWMYMMDYLVYGKIYAAVGFSTDFAEIDMAPEDILCYDLNGYDPVTSPSTLPRYCPNVIATAAGFACDGSDYNGFSVDTSAC